jgi:DNA-directed RNA polymerase specialized sigma24 family protein
MACRADGLCVDTCPLDCVSTSVPVRWSDWVKGLEDMQRTREKEQAFTRFVKETEPKLSHAFYAAYGPETGADVTSEALEYAWGHWDRVRGMENPAGYLYRVGQSRARWYHRPRVVFPSVATGMGDRGFEPALPGALGALSRNQRIAVVLIYAFEWTEQEVADLLGISRSSVRTHLERGLARLQSSLGVRVDG